LCVDDYDLIIYFVVVVDVVVVVEFVSIHADDYEWFKKEYAQGIYWDLFWRTIMGASGRLYKDSKSLQKWKDGVNKAKVLETNIHDYYILPGEAELVEDGREFGQQPNPGLIKESSPAKAIRRSEINVSRVEACKLLIWQMI
jgi:hypothetical protein